MDYQVKNIAQLLRGEIEGNPELVITGVSKIEEGKPGTLSFLANPKYTKYIYTTKSSVVLVAKTFIPEKPVEATLIRVEDPYSAIAELLRFQESMKPRKRGTETPVFIAPSANLGEDIYIGAFSYIGEKVVIGKGVQIYPQVYIGEGVTIGDHCIVYPGVKIYHGCKIGKNCIIHSGAVIGADGFGFAPSVDGVYQKLPQIGIVEIADDVEIGANTCIDRSTMGATHIQQGVKLDNLVQLGHNVEIGENTVIAAQTGVAGSAKVGKNCMIGGQVGIVGHLTVADGVKMGAKTGIMGAVRTPDVTLFGHPSMEYRAYMRSFILYKELPDLNARVAKLEKIVNAERPEKNND
jgi:UDP-3-O-[3-hydroxymyristoyl] glucosamine N-acyltransferase